MKENSIVEKIRDEINHINHESSDEDILQIIRDKVIEEIDQSTINYSDMHIFIQRIFNRLRSELDILQPYIDDPDVTEIMVNSPEMIFVERNGEIIQLDESFDDEKHLEDVVRRVVGKVHKEMNDMNPIVDARLSDGSRVNAVYKNIALNGSTMTIRKFPVKRIDMDFLIKNKTITMEAAKFLKCLVLAKYNILISGGTSSGKTTFLNVLTQFIPKEERIIIIEDSAEIQIDKLTNVIRMESKYANAQGTGQISIRDLIKASLRMRPDRIIVGEVRGEEALDMLQAMNTGHDGSISTGHSNSPKGMVNRLETMVMAHDAFPIESTQNQIGEAVDIIVHLNKINGSNRKVTEIVELIGYQNGLPVFNTLYELEFSGKKISESILKRTDNTLKNQSKMIMAGEILND